MIYTHTKPSFDSAVSIWALREYTDQFDLAKIAFVDPSKFDASILKDDDVAINLGAGKHCFSAQEKKGVLVGSCFAIITNLFAPKTAQRMLNDFLYQDKNIDDSVLNTRVLEHYDSDKRFVERMGLSVAQTLKAIQNRHEAEKEFEQVIILKGGQVALGANLKHALVVRSWLFINGIRGFVHSAGTKVEAYIRISDELTDVHHATIQDAIPENEKDQWHITSDAKTLFWDADYASQLNPKQLAKTLEGALQETKLPTREPFRYVIA